MKKTNNEYTKENHDTARKALDLLEKIDYFNPVLSSDRSYYSIACESFAEIYGKN